MRENQENNMRTIPTSLLDQTNQIFSAKHLILSGFSTIITIQLKQYYLDNPVKIINMQILLTFTLICYKIEKHNPFLLLFKLRSLYEQNFSKVRKAQPNMQNIIKTSRRCLALNEQNFPKSGELITFHLQKELQLHLIFDEKQNKIVTKKIDLEPR